MNNHTYYDEVAAHVLAVTGYPVTSRHIIPLPDLPDEIWTCIIRYGHRYGRVLFRILRTSKRMNRLAYASVTAFMPEHRNVSGDILTRLVNLQRVNIKTSCSPVIFTLTRLLSMRIDVDMSTTTEINLSALHLTKLIMLDVRCAGVPKTLIVFEIQRSAAYIDLSKHSKLTDLTVMCAPNVNGIEALTQLQHLRLGRSTYLTGNDIATMRQLRSVSLNSMTLRCLPATLESARFWLCGDVDVSGCTALQKLAARGHSRVSGIMHVRSLTIQNIHNIVPALHALTNLRRLTLTTTAAQTAIYNDVSVLTNLYTLRAQCDELGPLSHMTNLRELVIGRANNACIASLPPQLTNLTLEIGCRMMDIELCTLTSLTRLAVFTHAITSDGISHLTGLTELVMLNDVPMHDFTPLTCLRNLKFTKRMQSPYKIQLPLSIELFMSCESRVSMMHYGSNAYVSVGRAKKKTHTIKPVEARREIYQVENKDKK